MHPTRAVAVVGFVTTLLAILLIPLILIDAEYRSPYFWWRIIWAGTLALSVWSYLGGVLSPSLTARSNARLAGVAPAYGLVILVYAALSFVAMVCFAWLDPSHGPNRIHMVLQVMFGAVLIILSALLYLPAHFASEPTTSGVPTSTPSITTSVSRPSQLVAQLRSEEDRFGTLPGNAPISEPARQAVAALKTLREQITYSLDGMTGLENNADYRQLATRITTTCFSLSVIDTYRGYENQLSAAISEIQSLTRLTSTISTALRRR